MCSRHQHRFSRFRVRVVDYSGGQLCIQGLGYCVCWEEARLALVFGAVILDNLRRVNALGKRQSPTMLLKFFQWLPPESIKILLVLALSLLVGLEREEHKAAVEQPTFGGVRTTP